MGYLFELNRELAKFFIKKAIEKTNIYWNYNIYKNF